MRPIDADAFEADCRKRYCTGCENYNGIKCKSCWVDDMLGEVEDAPTLSPDEVRGVGEWEEIEVMPKAYDICGVETWASKMQCCNCGFTTFAIEGHFSQHNFCPSCGARMKGAEDGTTDNT